MIGHSKTLVIWFLFILQNITCSPVTILLSEKDRQCFYIEVEEKTEYTAKVVLLSGGSVGFSVSNLPENSLLWPLGSFVDIFTNIDVCVRNSDSSSELPALLALSLPFSLSGRLQFGLLQDKSTTPTTPV